MLKNINLKLEYIELSLIRTIVKDKRYKLWLDFAKQLKSSSFASFQDNQKIFYAERNPNCKEGLLGRILDRIADIEIKIQKEIK